MQASFVLAGALTLALAGSVSAQITTATFTDGNHYDWQFKHLPDLDQRRMFSGPILGLPGNGDMYCVPTSSMNMITYLAAHGFPTLSPGNHDWTDPSTYDIATIAIMNLGIFMGTTTTSGTTGGGFTGLTSWMSGSGPFIFFEDYVSGNHAPTLTTMTEMAMLGPLMDVCYGRYDIIGSFEGLPLVQRNGGHCMTVARTHANGASDKKLWTRDPADPNDGMETTQSTFANHQFSVTPKTLYIMDVPLPRKVTMSVLNFDPTSTTLACIDKYIAVLGLGAIFAENGASNSLDFYQPNALAGLPTQALTAYPVATKVLDASLDPDSFGITFLTSSALENLNTVTGAVGHLGNFPTATKVIHGRNRELYVLQDYALRTFDPEDDVPMVKSLPLPDLAQALCYDDANDQIVLLSTSGQALFLCSAGLGNPQEPVVVKLPPNVPASGAGSITVRAADGKCWFVSNASDSIFGVSLTGSVSSLETLSFPAISKPVSVDCDDSGRLFVTTASKIFVLAKGPNGWQITGDPAWNSIPPGPCFHLMKSHTNFDPNTMTGPAFNNLAEADLATWEQGPSIPDCGNDASDAVYGIGKPGTMGVPQLAALDPPFLGAPSTVQMTHALPGATPVILAGLSSAALPFDQGTLLVTPTFVVPFPIPVDASGNFSFTVTLPGDTSLCGLTLYEQVMFVDPGAVGFHHSAQTNGLARTLGS